MTWTLALLLVGAVVALALVWYASTRSPLVGPCHRGHTADGGPCNRARGPHQGNHERARRRSQIARGVLRIVPTPPEHVD